MAVIQSNDLELKTLGPDLQKLTGAFGYFANDVSLAGDASGGALTIRFTEVDDKGRNTRMFLPKVIDIRSGGNTAVVLAQILVKGKATPVGDRLGKWAELAIAIGVDAQGAARFDGSHIQVDLAHHGWWYPLRMGTGTNDQPGLFSMEVTLANPGATVTIFMAIHGLWSYFTPHR